MNRNSKDLWNFSNPKGAQKVRFFPRDLKGSKFHIKNSNWLLFCNKRNFEIYLFDFLFIFMLSFSKTLELCFHCRYSYNLQVMKYFNLQSYSPTKPKKYSKVKF